jgi:hypothetical protein
MPYFKCSDGQVKLLSDFISLIIFENDENLSKNLHGAVTELA